MMIIPVVMVFDSNYAIPAAVTIHSLLKNGAANSFFELVVVHSGLPDSVMERLRKQSSGFGNASIRFINMGDMFDDIWPSIKVRKSYSKEILYRLLLPGILPDVDKAVVTDVDIVFQGDISGEFAAFDSDSDDYYAGVKDAQIGKKTKFSLDIRDDNAHFMVSARYMIFNLRKMREDGMQKKYLDLLYQHVDRLVLVEQEVLNISCYPRIKLLHPKNIVSNTWFRTEDFRYDYEYNATEDELREALAAPIAIHYDSWHFWTKPWRDPYCPKANIWYQHLAETEFFEDQFRDNLYYDFQKARKIRKRIKLRAKVRKILGF